MTPRQQAAARKRIDKLNAQQNRAMKPLYKRLDASNQVYLKALHKLEAKQEREKLVLRKRRDSKTVPIIRRLKKIEETFDRRIQLIARHIDH